MSHISALNHVPVITLDGPSGTGKGTLCHRLASILGWHVLDSGAIYRALALSVLQDAVYSHDIEHLVALARTLPLRFFSDERHYQHVYLGEQDVSEFIRSEQIGQEASKLAAIPEVRAALLMRQREYAQAPGLVTDGRDMGTVVFPEADLKIYLDASEKERASRRYLQLQQKGEEVRLEDIMTQLLIRDARDKDRRHAPLTAAADAVHIDTTGLGVVQVLESILQLAAARGLYNAQHQGKSS